MQEHAKANFSIEDKREFLARNLREGPKGFTRDRIPSFRVPRHDAEERNAVDGGFVQQLQHAPGLSYAFPPLARIANVTADHNGQELAGGKARERRGDRRWL